MSPRQKLSLYSDPHAKRDVAEIKQHFLKNSKLQQLYINLTMADKYTNFYTKGVTKIAKENDLSTYMARKLLVELVDIKAICGFQVKQATYKLNYRDWYYRWIFADWEVRVNFADYVKSKLDQKIFLSVVG